MLNELRQLIQGSAQKVAEVPDVIRESPALAESFGSIHDAAQSLGGFLRRLNQFSITNFGWIQECFPYLRSYRVTPAGGGAPILCCRLGELPTTPIGVSDHTTLQPGTPVYYVKHPGAFYGAIIGVEPSFQCDPRKARSDCIGQASNAGFNVERYWKALMAMSGGRVGDSGVTDWSAMQPVDSYEAGEFCKTSSTGIQLLIDDYMAQLRVDEMCGLQMFYWDSLLRIAGRNMQIWTAGSEKRVDNDEGEVNIYEGEVAYPWEQLGQVWYPSDQGYTANNAETCQHTTPWYGPYEPKYNDMQPFHRVQRWGGYLAQGEMSYICAPDTRDTTSVSNAYRYSNNKIYTGLLQEVRTLEGRYGLRSATSITFTRRPCIPVPRRIRQPEDTSGASADTYKGSGAYGSGTNHVAPQPFNHSPWLSGTNPWDVADAHARLFNWDAGYPLHYKDGDFAYPDESDLPKIQTNQEVPHYADLLGGGYLDDFTFDSVGIDRRTAGLHSVRVARATQYITLCEDGGIVISDGWGSEIRMDHGNICFFAASNILTHATNCISSYAGISHLFASRGGTRLSASCGDIGLYAGHSIRIISGGDGDTSAYGGVEITSYADENTGGILLRSPYNDVEIDSRSLVADLSENICISAGGVTSGEPTGGNIAISGTCMQLEATDGAVMYSGGARICVVDTEDGGEVVLGGDDSSVYVPNNLYVLHLCAADVETGEIVAGTTITGTVNASMVLVSGEVHVEEWVITEQGFFSNGLYYSSQVVDPPNDGHVQNCGQQQLMTAEECEYSCMPDMSEERCSAPTGCDTYCVGATVSAPIEEYTCTLPVAAPRWMWLNATLSGGNELDVTTWDGSDPIGNYESPLEIFTAEVSAAFDMATQLSGDRTDTGLQNTSADNTSAFGAELAKISTPPSGYY
jgi:hypothetical protein